MMLGRIRLEAQNPAGGSIAPPRCSRHGSASLNFLLSIFRGFFELGFLAGCAADFSSVFLLLRRPECCIFIDRFFLLSLDGPPGLQAAEPSAGKGWIEVMK